MFRYLPLLALLSAPVAEAAPTKVGLSTSAAAVSMSTTKTCTEVTGTTATSANAEDLPSSGGLNRLRVQGDTLAGGATTVTWYVALDSGGDLAITDSVTETLLTGKTTATDASANTIFSDAMFTRTDDATRGSLWVCHELDAGTMNGEFYLTWWQARR